MYQRCDGTFSNGLALEICTERVFEFVNQLAPIILIVLVLVLAIRVFLWLVQTLLSVRQTNRVYLHHTGALTSGQIKQLADGARSYHDRILWTFDKLGFSHTETSLLFTWHHRVLFERIEATEGRFYYKIAFASPLRYGMSWNLLPEGVFISDLVSDKTREALSQALQCPVETHCSVSDGAWLVVVQPDYEDKPETWKPYLDQRVSQSL